jgi:glycosyltransferase involved in cell wall biosynthesis
MITPVISVLLPAYNCEAFLAKAMESVLKQDYEDFELLVINDGSTDTTASIARSFNDPRVVYITNERNSGLIYTLNKGIELAKGRYIARMDADDICLPGRFAQQVALLEANPALGMVAAPVVFINEAGNETGIWELDRNTMTTASIKKIMPYENCIAHPSVMIRAVIAKQLRYSSYQKNIEDYDLWLRILSRGYLIGKTTHSGLRYRVHSNSITGTELKKKNFFFIHARMKARFAGNEIKNGRFNFFIARVLLAMVIDWIKGCGKAIKKLFRK